MPQFDMPKFDRPKLGRPRLSNQLPRPMDAGRLRVLGMDSEVWKRHASGWSVWTRFATLPFLYLAIWSFSVTHWFNATGLTAAVIFWLWLNPRIFPAPRRFDRWHSRAVLGERVWLNRSAIPVPAHENRKALVFSAIAGLGFLLGLWGALSPSVEIMVAGMLITYAGKLAFLAVMVQIYDLMRDAHPLYRSWTQVPDNDNSRPPSQKHGGEKRAG